MVFFCVVIHSLFSGRFNRGLHGAFDYPLSLDCFLKLKGGGPLHSLDYPVSVMAGLSFFSTAIKLRVSSFLGSRGLIFLLVFCFRSLSEQIGFPY